VPRIVLLLFDWCLFSTLLGIMLPALSIYPFAFFGVQLGS
jgi:hypothetical protein